MVVNKDIAREYLHHHMTPGVWYRQNELHDLFESVYDKWDPIDYTPIKSEPKRPRWRRHVGNCLRMSPDYGSFSDNSWVELRSRRINPDSDKGPFEYSIAPRDPVEEELVRSVRFDDGSGYVYAITNPAWPGWVKIGMTIDIDGRLAAYQTYSPGNDYSVAHSVKVRDRRRSEALAHWRASDASAGVSGEWFRIPMTEAANILESLD